MKRIIITIFLALILTLPVAAHATDGVIEINQAKVTAAGGFPYVISQPGSYRLTSNLTQTDGNVVVIQINANDVTIDLNGFAIYGPNSCTYAAGSGTSCTQSGTGHAISGSGWLIVVKNGSISGAGGACIHLSGEGSRVADMSLAQCGFDGIYLAGSSTVQSCRVVQNGGSGIWLEGNAVISDNVVQKNGWFGIIGQAVNNDAQAIISRNVLAYNGREGVEWVAGPQEGITVSQNTIYKNGGAGIEVNSGVVIGNLVHWNTGVGLDAGYAVSMRDNNFQGNNSGGAQTSSSGVLYNGGGNMCGPVACP